MSLVGCMQYTFDTGVDIANQLAFTQHISAHFRVLNFGEKLIPVHTSFTYFVYCYMFSVMYARCFYVKIILMPYFAIFCIDIHTEDGGGLLYLVRVLVCMNAPNLIIHEVTVSRFF